MEGSHGEAIGGILASKGITTGAFVLYASGWSVRVSLAKNNRKVTHIQLVNLKSSRFLIIVENKPD